MLALGLLRGGLNWMKVALVQAQRGRGAAGKTPVFGLLKRDGKVYVEIVGRDHVIDH